MHFLDKQAMLRTLRYSALTEEKKVQKKVLCNIPAQLADAARYAEQIKIRKGYADEWTSDQLEDRLRQARESGMSESEISDIVQCARGEVCALEKELEQGK